MRILFIGKDNLQNEAIIKIINAEDDYEVNHVLPVHVEEQAVEPNRHKYKIALADLASFSYRADVSIKLIKSNNLSYKIIAIHNHNEKNIIQLIIDAGADFCFSVNSGGNELLEMIKSLSRPTV